MFIIFIYLYIIYCGGVRDALPDFLLSLSFPCLVDHAGDWPSCK